VDLAIGGGTPQPTSGADISVAYDPAARAVTVTNAGPVAATVTVQSSFLGICGLGVYIDGTIWSTSQVSLWTVIHPIRPGQTVGGLTVLEARCDLGLVGIQVVASDQPDPDSTPGNSIVGEDDYAVIARATP